MKPGRSPRSHVLPISYLQDIAPGERVTVSVRSNTDEFPDKVYFALGVIDSFEIHEISLLPWKKTPVVLLSRDRDDRVDSASVNEYFRHVVLPAHVDLAFVVRNISDVPRPFVCAIISCSTTHWWDEMHEHSVKLTEEEARDAEAVLMQCADGSPRRDLRLSVAGR